MPRKKMTEAEKKAWGAKMKAARAKKRVLPKESVETHAAYSRFESEDVAELKRQIDELKKAMGQQLQTPVLTSRGLLGTQEKYPIDPKYYPDPRDKLSSEPRLEREAFKHRYELKYEVTVSSYETVDGRRIKEPKFNLDLIGIVVDDDGEDTGKRYIARKAVFHEDPDAALIMAREQGVVVDESREKEFLDEMRYLRMRDWLFDIFWPKPPKPQEGFREEVIGNRLVTVYSVNSEESQTMPFDKLK